MTTRWGFFLDAWVSRDGFKTSGFQSWPPKPSLSWTLNILRREAWGLIPEVVSRAWQRRVVLALAMLWCAWISFMPRLCSGVAWTFSLVALILDVYSFDTDLIIASLVICQGRESYCMTFWISTQLHMSYHWICGGRVGGFEWWGTALHFKKKPWQAWIRILGPSLWPKSWNFKNWYWNRKPLLSCQRFLSLGKLPFWEGIDGLPEATCHWAPSTLCRSCRRGYKNKIRTSTRLNNNKIQYQNYWQWLQCYKSNRLWAGNLLSEVKIQTVT